MGSQILVKQPKNVRVPVNSGHHSELFGGVPQHPDHDGVAVHHDGGGHHEHDDQLVPGEQDARAVGPEVDVGARLHDDVRLVVVEQIRVRALTRKKLHIHTFRRC